MKFIVLAVLLVLGVVAALAVEKESLKPAEQVYLASPYAYSAYGAYGAYPALGYGAYYYR